MHYKKFISIILAAFISAVLATGNFVSAANLDQAVSTLPVNDEWSIMAYASMGQTVGHSYLRSPLNSSIATDYEKRILAITAIGQNPSTFGDENFVAKLEGMFDGVQIGDTALINDDIFGLLALHSAGISGNTTDKLRQRLLQTQNPDGGWGFATGAGSDSNMTAMAVAALATQGSVPSTAINYLQQTKSSSSGYGFAPGQAPDGASTAWVISGLISAGQSVPDDAKTFLENLQISNGQFKWRTNDATGSALVTAYSVVALSGHGYPVGKVTSSPTPNPVPPPAPAPTPTPSPSPAPVPPPPPSTIPTVSSFDPDCMVRIYHTDFHMPDGGQIVRINGELYFHKTYLSECNNSPSPTPTPTPSPSPAPVPPPPPSTIPTVSSFDPDCMVRIYHTDFHMPDGGQIVRINGELYFHKTYLAGCENAGSTVSGTVNVTPNPIAVPRTPLPPSAVPRTAVHLKISHPDKTIFNDSVNIAGSTSVMTVLRNATFVWGISLQVNQTALGEFVQSIDNRGPSGTSGWQYAVNGTVPNTSASDYIVRSGDEIIWFYGPPGSSPY